MRNATADCVVMAAALACVALAVWLFGGLALQRVVCHAAILLTGVLALQIFSGNTGIVSFGHAAFMGIGAYSVGLLTMSPALQASALPQLPDFMTGHAMSLAGALLVTMGISLIAGGISGLPLLRLSGSAASIATLALLIIVYTVLTAAREITRGSQPFYGVPRHAHLWTAIVAAIAVLAVARVFRETSWGLAARATANDEHGAASLGIDRRWVIFATWMLSIVVAGVAGGLLAQFLGAFTPHGFYFQLAFSLLAALIVGGMGSSWGALCGVTLTTVIVQVARRCESGGELLGITMPTLFGLPEAALALGMLLVIWARPQGLTHGLELDVLRRLGLERRPRIPPASAGRIAGNLLRVERVTKRYAGLTAVDDVSIEIPQGSIIGLIGPNGAGKTTLLNLISGFAAATSGRIWLGEKPLERASAYRMARAGIARTFQNIRIFPRMSVFENVLAAARQKESGLAAAERAAWRELTALELGSHASHPAGSLPYGLRRRLEIARALALNPGFLLLDEPAAGMTPVETEELIRILARARAERGVGIVLVEHDLQLVMKLCEHLFVLDQGRLIASGAPRQVQGNPAVVAAYLGTRTSDRMLASGAPGGVALEGVSDG
jgi:branched-chain amino acid transport system permease protein